MSTDIPHSSLPESTPSVLLEGILDTFEAAWERGERPQVDAHLPAGEPLRRAVLVELVHADLEWRLKSGEAARAEEYLNRYPELAQDPRLALELIAAEHRLRRRAEPDLGAAEYARRFPQHADALPALLEADSQGAVSTVTSHEYVTPPLAEAGRPHLPGYEILGELGHGGMGVVYRATQTNLGRAVALKMVRAGIHASAAERQRFRTEAEAVARLQHPNIVQIYEVGERDSLPYLALELCAGGSLEKKLAGTPLPPREAAALVEKLARAMEAAHAKGVIHRDLKPANVLLAEDGTPKITDFGLARKLEDTGQTASGAILGTPSYMAPEQAEGKVRATGPACDVYALGAILYQCLTGRPPFRGETHLETLRQVIAEEPVPPSRLNSRTPRDLQTICLKCLHKAPSRRYATASALAEDLRRFQAGEPIVARPVRAWERALKWARRRPAAAALLLLAVLAAGFLLALALHRERQDAELRNRVGSALEQAGRLQGQAQWADARAVLERAGGWLGDSGPEELRAQLERMRGELELTALLDSIRLRKARIVLGKLDFPSADRDYATAFAEAGLAREGEEAAVVAERVRRSAIREQLVAALDDWAITTTDAKRRAWVLQIARGVAPHPWCDRFRDPQIWDDGKALQRLADEAPVAELSPQLLAVVGIRLMGLGADPQDFLKAAQQQHPGDFWLNFVLASVLTKTWPQEAVGYHRAALAVRPTTSVVYNNLAVALQACGHLPEAIACWRKAVELDPRDPHAHYNLGQALVRQERLEEAIDVLKKATRLNPTDAHALTTLGVALRANGRLEEALTAHRKATELDPKLWVAYYNLSFALQIKGAEDEAIAARRKAIELGPAMPKDRIPMPMPKDDSPPPKDAGLAEKTEKDGNSEWLAPPPPANVPGHPDWRRLRHHNTPVPPLPPKVMLSGVVDPLRIPPAVQPPQLRSPFPYRAFLSGIPSLASTAQFHPYGAGYSAASTEKLLPTPPGSPDWRRVLHSDTLALPKVISGGVDDPLRAPPSVQPPTSPELTPPSLQPPTTDPTLNPAQPVPSPTGPGVEADPFTPILDNSRSPPKDAVASYFDGQALARAGRLDEAVAAYRKAVASDLMFAPAHGALGAALLRQGRLAEARTATQRCLSLLSARHRDRTVLEKQLARCDRLLKLDAQLPAFLKGERRPAGAAEQLALAELCHYQKRHAAAVGFYSAAFTAQPKLAQDLDSGHRYDAACSAVLAATKGRDPKGKELDEQESARLRRQALDWLRADLTAWGEHIARGSTRDAATRLLAWRADPALAGVRERPALAKLPQAERAAWEQLWDDLAALLERAHLKSDKGKVPSG